MVRPLTSPRAEPVRLIDAEDPAERSASPALLVIWGVWTLAVIVLLASHEMWRDELQAWAIARDSSNPLDLLSNLRYEGHPPSWHLVLWVASRVSRSPVTLQIVNAACASAATWIVLRHLPYTLVVRVLLVTGYFPLYEFGAISRSYGLMYLLAVAFLALADRSTRWTPALVVLLVAMASTLVIALPFVAALTVGQSLRWRMRPRRGLAAGAVVAVGCAIGVALAWAPGNVGNVTAQVPDDLALDRVLRAPARVLLPMPELKFHFWNSFMTSDLDAREVLLGAVVVIGVALALRRCLPAVVVWVVSALGFVVVVSVLSLPMEARHLSVLWMSLLAAAWMAGAEGVARPPAEAARFRPVVKVLGVLALVAAVVGAGTAASAERRDPFSGGEGAAAWIGAEFDEPVTLLCATRAPSCSTVAIRLDERAYMQADLPPFSFVTWHRQRPGHRTGSDLLVDARVLAERTGREVVIITRFADMPPGCEAGWVSELTIEASERMVVCGADQLTEARS